MRISAVTGLLCPTRPQDLSVGYSSGSPAHPHVHRQNWDLGAQQLHEVTSRGVQRLDSSPVRFQNDPSELIVKPPFHG